MTAEGSSQFDFRECGSVASSICAKPDEKSLTDEIFVESVVEFFVVVVGGDFSLLLARVLLPLLALGRSRRLLAAFRRLLLSEENEKQKNC